MERTGLWDIKGSIFQFSDAAPVSPSRWFDSRCVSSFSLIVCVFKVLSTQLVFVGSYTSSLCSVSPAIPVFPVTGLLKTFVLWIPRLRAPCVCEVWQYACVVLKMLYLRFWVKKILFVDNFGNIYYMSLNQWDLRSNSSKKKCKFSANWKKTSW